VDGAAGPCAAGVPSYVAPRPRRSKPTVRSVSAPARPRVLIKSQLVIDVRFSNRPFGVKRFQTIHQHSVDVAHGLVLLFGIGAKALPSWDSKTRRNNLWDGLAVSVTAGQADIRSHLIHRPARDIIPPLSGIRVSSYWIRCCTVFMLLLWPVLGSSGTRCRQPICGA
jgi:hypothetical protein